MKIILTELTLNSKLNWAFNNSNLSSFEWFWKLIEMWTRNFLCQLNVHFMSRLEILGWDDVRFYCIRNVGFISLIGVSISLIVAVVFKCIWMQGAFEKFLIRILQDSCDEKYLLKYINSGNRSSMVRKFCNQVSKFLKSSTKISNFL